MRTVTSERGFRVVEHPKYLSGATGRLVGESSAIGDYEDAWERPGSSYLWIGDDYHLNREEVAQLTAKL